MHLARTPSTEHSPYVPLLSGKDGVLKGKYLKYLKHLNITPKTGLINHSPSDLVPCHAPFSSSSDSFQAPPKSEKKKKKKNTPDNKTNDARPATFGLFPETKLHISELQYNIHIVQLRMRNSQTVISPTP
ncbi:hypothetical protein PCH_Pc12g15410 [Penicillium rubens Wisconsin 54-1255]|uniref:Uncharacterized protein n=1 Tax=Penicillium rubens (strain ATCC 28089 / DSM 1075 / NRRL 1951 / Wisconsin 54-1255) TaxID=500485 RepID=B6GXR8_PENRW|nr:hypothetical protein PCH_Pc12g15410 [Penicillium rubens Wisconsin 54-1255]